MNAAHRYSEYYTGKMKKKKKSTIFQFRFYPLWNKLHSKKQSYTQDFKHCIYINCIYVIHPICIEWPQTEQYGNLKTEIINICIQ